MLTFFRRIRKGLLGDGATSKYLLYAIGEIALVVIGILVALQINNWNEERKNKSKVKTHLINLIKDLENDFDTFDSDHSFHDFRFNAFVYLLKMIDADLQNYDPIPNPDHRWGWLEPYPDTINRKFIELGFQWFDHGFASVIVNRMAIDEIKHQGLFSYIQNDQLKESINNYYNHVDWVFGDRITDEFQNEAIEFGKYLRDKYGIMNQDISNVDDPLGLLRRNNDVQLRLQTIIRNTHNRCMDAIDSKRRAQELIGIIESVIKKN